MVQKWQRILDLEAMEKGLPPPYLSKPPTPPVANPPDPSKKAIEQIAKDVRLARNVGLAFAIPKMIPGLIVLWVIIYLVWNG